ncbi:MAG: DUF4369 domain-containing protein [Prevotellaceae bacterium]|nr:DUF4369 domain-containing protein [Prevotellaceae bacterium]MDY3856912.1 DUF4369 domain-containing protein [Bacteroidaceae bacterium]
MDIIRGFVRCSIRSIERLCCMGGLLLGLTSCSEQYNISGDSSVSTLDGRMLYLKALTSNDDMCNIDSCEVVHGKFNFMGMMDSTTMGEIYMDNEGVMPIVIENGNISILINNTEQRVVGGALNSRLYRFLEAKSHIEDEIMNLSNEEANMILSGIDPMTAHSHLAEKNNRLYTSLEQLETRFIADNSDNILGSTYFMMLCSQYPYPIMTEQIQRIIKKSKPSFRRSAYVRNYVTAAEANMKLIKQSNPAKTVKVANR